MFEEPLPKNKAGQPQEHTPYEIHRSNEYFQREYLVAVQEIKILQARAHMALPPYNTHSALTSSSPSPVCRTATTARVLSEKWRQSSRGVAAPLARRRFSLLKPPSPQHGEEEREEEFGRVAGDAQPCLSSLHRTARSCASSCGKRCTSPTMARLVPLDR